jgi:hypothetical protein
MQLSRMNKKGVWLGGRYDPRLGATGYGRVSGGKSTALTWQGESLQVKWVSDTSFAIQERL